MYKKYAIFDQGGPVSWEREGMLNVFRLCTFFSRMTSILGGRKKENVQKYRKTSILREGGIIVQKTWEDQYLEGRKKFKCTKVMQMFAFL